MNLSVSIFNFCVVFTPPNGKNPATLTWNAVTEPGLNIATNYALITADLKTNGHGQATWASAPINWLDPTTRDPISQPPNFSVRRESDHLCTLIDHNTSSTATDYVFTATLQYNGESFTFEPTIVNIKPGG